MNKSEAREVNTLIHWHAVGVNAGGIARALSALIRASRTKRSRDALLRYADIFEVRQHPEFII